MTTDDDRRIAERAVAEARAQLASAESNLAAAQRLNSEVRLSLASPSPHPAQTRVYRSIISRTEEEIARLETEIAGWRHLLDSDAISVSWSAT